jgi:hypothetical protein
MLGPVIPTILLPSFIIGRWWVIPAATVIWAVVLLLTNTIGAADIPGAAGFAAANATVGVVAHKVISWPLRLAWRRRAAHSSS